MIALRRLNGYPITALTEGVLHAAKRPDLASQAADALVIEGEYSFAQLMRIRRDVSRIMRGYDVHGIGIDEAQNRITLDVGSPDAVASLLEVVRNNDIDAQALDVRVAARGQYTHHIGGHFTRIFRDGVPWEESDCTLTQAVQHMRPDVTLDTLVFGITVSHCTAQWGSVDADVIVNGSTPIADIVWDHPFVTDARCVALTGTTVPMCRYSDAALFQYRQSFVSTVDRHKVQTADSLKGEIEFLIVGDIVHMRGQVSGTLTGKIKHTCFDRVNDLPPFMSGQIGQLCQYGADYEAQQGDSGGPVWHYDEFGTRLFAGIQSYRLPATGGPNTVSYFSGVTYIMEEIVPTGAGWGWVCQSFPGPGVSPGSSTCPW